MVVAIIHLTLRTVLLLYLVYVEAKDLVEKNCFLFLWFLEDLVTMYTEHAA